MNRFVHNKSSLEWIEALERLLQNWNSVLFCPANCKTWSSSDCICHVPAQVISNTIKQKCLELCQKLLWCLPETAAKKVFFTDEQNFHLNTPVNNSNKRVLAVRKKREVDENCLMFQRAKFVPHIMVSAGACFNGNGWLHLIPEKDKVNAKLYVDSLGLCYQNWLQTARLFCQMASFSNRMVRLHTLHEWHTTGLPPTTPCLRKKQAKLFLS